MGERWPAASRPFDCSDLSTYRGIYGGFDIKPVREDVLVLDGLNPADLLLDDKIMMHELLFTDAATQIHRPMSWVISMDRNPAQARSIQKALREGGYTHAMIKSAEGTRGEGVMLVNTDNILEYLELFATPVNIASLDAKLMEKFAALLPPHASQAERQTLMMAFLKKFIAIQGSQNHKLLIESCEASKQVIYEGNPYQPTMRAAFVAVRNQGEMTIHCLGSYWKIPTEPMNTGSMTEKQVISSYEIHKGDGSDPLDAIRAVLVAEADEITVSTQLKAILPSIMQRAWTFDVDTYIEPLKTTNPPYAFYFLIRLANSYSERGLFALAHHYVDQAIELRPTQAHGYHNKGQIFYAQDQYKSAIDCYTTALAKEQAMEMSHCRRAQAYWKLGNRVAANADCQAAKSKGIAEDRIIQLIYGLDKAHTFPVLDWSTPLEPVSEAAAYRTARMPEVQTVGKGFSTEATLQ